jgi:UDP-N-acetylglucosamine--N-acetylmuramyl-(pentapeptide) pyrophosphoryl-undecaprenol N-acetylglucosamine transferase
MKIIFTGGGTGGHFYPIIAVAEEVNKITDKEKILESNLYYMSDSPYDKHMLFETGLTYVPVSAGKLRQYFSIKNFFDLFKTFFGVIGGFFSMYSIFPDVVFAKGGYSSFPALVAARILRIPVVIHESDSAPGRVNRWAGKFATRVAVSFEEAGTYFPSGKTAWTGQPVRANLRQAAKEGAFEYLKLDPSVPVILILGGSQGAEIINNGVLDALPELLTKYQVIHQTGEKNFDDVMKRSNVVLYNHPNIDRYKPFPYLNDLAMKMSAGASALVVSRAGSTIFEIASWGAPSIIIPITKSNGDHQMKNAFAYARAGACVVLEESNLTGNIINAEADKIISNKKKREEMSAAALRFSKPDAAAKIARELVNIALSHEK